MFISVGAIVLRAPQAGTNSGTLWLPLSSRERGPGGEVAGYDSASPEAAMAARVASMTGRWRGSSSDWSRRAVSR